MQSTAQRMDAHLRADTREARALISLALSDDDIPAWCRV